MDAYIDNIVVKSKEEPNYIKDLTKVFAILIRHKLRPSTTKCTFEVSLGKFLGRLVMIREIEANPEQITAINNLVSPRNEKEVQKLIGIAAALNRFINKSSDKCPKADLSSQLSKWAIKLERSDIKFLPKAAIKGQVLPDFVAEFSPQTVILEQTCLDSAHKEGESSQVGYSEIQLVSEVPEVARETTQDTETTTISETSGIPKVFLEPSQIDPTSAWKMFIDKARNNLRVGAGVVLKSLEGVSFEHYLRLNFPSTNNKAKYEAFIAGLRSASKLKISELHIFSDSKLVVNQVIRKFKTPEAKTAKYLAVAKNILKEFKAMKIE
ncbi:hypothetical protein Acr_10g0007060 [Actinidia rufa]|uniref:RNase H type-1 domain-containing protein n=1 Tax=Actinidia rufa TaxID=165716 RepID=A0A7J0F9J2_9ERIC|nr:hypothetical protein Acr_10g0007060 [Actinidia rufa]